MPALAPKILLRRYQTFKANNHVRTERLLNVFIKMQDPWPDTERIHNPLPSYYQVSGPGEGSSDNQSEKKENEIALPRLI